MPSSLTPRIGVVLILLAFSVGFGLRALGGSPAPKPAEGHTRAEAAERPGPKPDMSLAAARTVPDLKDPRVRHVRKPKPRPKQRQVAAAKPPPVRVASRPGPTPASTPRPAAPRYAPTPAPRYVAPRRTAAPTPKATPAPSGEFDTSGRRFDSAGAR